MANMPAICWQSRHTIVLVRHFVTGGSDADIEVNPLDI